MCQGSAISQPLNTMIIHNPAQLMARKKQHNRMEGWPLTIDTIFVVNKIK